MLSYAFNSIFGSVLVLLLIGADYLRRWTYDRLQRYLFLTVIGCSIVALFADAAWVLLEDHPGMAITVGLYIALTLYYLTTAASYYVVLLFIDYFVCRNIKRLKIIAIIAIVLNSINLILLIINIWEPIYFDIGKYNEFERADFYSIRLVLAFFPVFGGFLDIAVSPKGLRRLHISFFLLFILLTSAGAIADIIFDGYLLLWPLFTAAMLFSYFFIIRRETRTDPLTGLENRYSFNEFINHLEEKEQILKQKNEKRARNWTITMIDMDNFKEINDTLGHSFGDIALQDMAKIIRANIRQIDRAVRYGGDEFVILRPGLISQDEFVTRLKKALSEHNNTMQRPFRLQISHGSVYYLPGKGQKIQSLMAEVDALMYEDKNDRSRIDYRHYDRRQGEAKQ
jgi:diguanylate cyclase (GGDEF)-like protein